MVKPHQKIHLSFLFSIVLIIILSYLLYDKILPHYLLMWFVTNIIAFYVLKFKTIIEVYLDAKANFMEFSLALFISVAIPFALNETELSAHTIFSSSLLFAFIYMGLRGIETLRSKLIN